MSLQLTESHFQAPFFAPEAFPHCRRAAGGDGPLPAADGPLRAGRVPGGRRHRRRRARVPSGSLSGPPAAWQPPPLAGTDSGPTSGWAASAGVGEGCLCSPTRTVARIEGVKTSSGVRSTALRTEDFLDPQGSEVTLGEVCFGPPGEANFKQRRSL